MHLIEVMKNLKFIEGEMPPAELLPEKLYAEDLAASAAANDPFEPLQQELWPGSGGSTGTS